MEYFLPIRQIFKGNSEYFLWSFKPLAYPKHTTTSSWLPFPLAPFGLAGAVWRISFGWLAIPKTTLWILVTLSQHITK